MANLDSKAPPPIVPEKDWRPLVLPYEIGSGRTLFAATQKNLRLALFERSTDQHVVGRIWFGAAAAGPPLHVHGGASAYILDECMGSVAWVNHYPAMAANLDFEYLLMSPLFVDLHLHAWIEKVEPRRLKIVAELNLEGGTTCVRGRGDFARLSQSQFHKFAPAGADATTNEFLKQTLHWVPENSGGRGSS